MNNKISLLAVVAILMLVVPVASALKLPSLLSPTSGGTLSGTARFNISFELDNQQDPHAWNMTVTQGSTRLCLNTTGDLANDTNYTFTCTFNSALLNDNASVPFVIKMANAVNGSVLNNTISATYNIDNSNPDAVNFTFSKTPLGDGSTVTANVGSEVTSGVICFGENCYSCTMGASSCVYTISKMNPADSYYDLSARLGDGVDSNVVATDASNLRVQVTAMPVGVSSEVLDANNALFVQQAQAQAQAQSGGNNNNVVILIGLGVLVYFLFIRK